MGTALPGVIQHPLHQCRLADSRLASHQYHPSRAVGFDRIEVFETPVPIRLAIDEPGSVDVALPVHPVLRDVDQ